MSPERWKKIGEIFETAAEIALPAERVRFLTEACGEDAELRSEVEKLLRQDAAAADLLSAPLMDHSGLHVFAEMIENHDPMIGKIVGVYRLEKEIGRGGMGAVYLAERADGSFRQRVAIKLIKRGMDTDFILRRFRQERQILAALNHPNIARLLDGGTTADDLPFFVMEYIEGKPLYKFSDERKLSIHERLKLFRQVCGALDFAHENQVIHRDIKPPNILVTENGIPKLLDFGIAKVLDPDLSIETIDPTATAMRLMTPEYASPEQVSGAPVSPASDIYSLGVLLYELLTGHRPYRFQNRAPHEIARVICEEEPMRPGTGITREDNLLPTDASEATTLEDISMARGAANLQDLQRELSGDLEKIILKCLRKDPSERYQTAAGLSADILRFLQGRAVAAESYQRISIEQTPLLNNGAGTKSLAVLPLKFLNPAPNADTGEDFLSIGLADALVSRLSGVQRLIVRPTSSVLRFESNHDAFAAGRELGVEFVVDGNIRRAGKRLRVTAQLLNVGENLMLWSESFDERYTDVLELEDSLSKKIAASLLPKLTGDEEKQLNKRGTNSPEAYEIYLKGRFYWNQFTPDALPKAISCFQKAVELDPNFALAHVGVADFYIWANIYGIIPSPEATEQSEIAVKKALEIDDTLGEAYSTYGLVKQNTFEWEESAKLHRRAMELNPNYPNAHEWYSANLIGSGQIETGLKHLRRSEELDPLSLRTKTLVAWTLYQARKFSEAYAKSQEIIRLDGNYPQGHLQQGYVLIELGRAEEAVVEIEKGIELMPESALAKYYLAFALAAAKRRNDARKVLAEMKAEARRGYVKPMFLGLACVAVGEIDEAFEYLNRAADEFDPWLVWFATEIKLEPLRRDRRYYELLKRTRNPQYENLAKNRESEFDRLHVSRDKNKSFEKSGAIRGAKPNLFNRHRFKFGAAAILLIGLFAAYRTGFLTVRFEKDGFTVETAQTAAAQIHSIAVLPFANETADAGNDYLSDGLSENLINRLSSLPQIRVLSRSTSFKYKGKPFDPPTIGKETNVETILTGSVQQSNDELTVKIELVKAADGMRLWAMDFRDKSDKITVLQNKIGDQLIEKLNVREQARAQKIYTENNQALELYLKGEFHRQKATPADIKTSIEFYRKALELDANYALAYQGLAHAYRSSPAYGTLTPQEAYPQAKEAAMKALAIDPTLGTAYVPLASIKAIYDWDFENAEKEYRQAIQLAPNNAEAHSSFGNFLVAMNRTDEALNEYKIARQIDPLSLNTATNIGWALYIAGRYAEAEAQIKQVIAHDPTFARAYMNLGEIYQEQGRFDEAVNAFQKSKQLSGDALAEMALGHALATAGRKTEAARIAAELEEKVRLKEVSPFLPAVVYAGLNEKDKSFYWLERAFQERSNWLTLIKVGRRLKPLRSDPRFDDLLKRIGFKD